MLVTDGRHLSRLFIAVASALAVALVLGGWHALGALETNRQRTELALSFAHLADSTARLETALVRAVETRDADARMRLAKHWQAMAYHWMLIDALAGARRRGSMRDMTANAVARRLAGWHPPHWHAFDGLALPPGLSAVMGDRVHGTTTAGALASVLLAAEPIAFGSGPLDNAESAMLLTIRRALHEQTLLDILHNGSTIMVKEFAASGEGMRHTLLSTIAVGLALLAVLLALVLLPLARRIERDGETLSVALESARAGEKAKAEFLATMSHELRTPLNGVLGMAALLHATRLDTRQRACVETIRSAGAALAGVIGDILEYSRLNDGRLTLANDSFASEDLARGPGVKMGPAANLKGLDLTIRLDPAAPVRLRGDLERLDHVITNLLANAVKFTATGEIRVDIATRPNGTDNVMLEVAVTDTGPGVAPDKVAGLFALFEQADQTATRTAPGTGVGLAICHSLVTLMGGRIWLEPRSGAGGASFRFAVPLGVADPTPWMRPSALLEGCRVDLVIANARRRAIIGEGLSAWGVAVRARPDAAPLPDDAAAAPDIVIVDDSPPMMPGPETVAALAAQWPGVAAVVLSATDVTVDHTPCRVLRKPVQPGLLRQTLEHLYAQRAARALLDSDLCTDNATRPWIAAHR